VCAAGAPPRQTLSVLLPVCAMCWPSLGSNTAFSRCIVVGLGAIDGCQLGKQGAVKRVL